MTDEQIIGAAEESDAAESWRLWEGQVMDGQFTLLRYLGGSDHSAVFTTETREGGQAAIKLAPIELSGDRPQIALTRSLSHPYLIRLLHAGTCRVAEADCSYTVSEYAEDSLAHVLPTRALLPEECEAALPPILEALAYLHEQPVAHGRLKPSNLLRVRGQLKLASDGLFEMGAPVAVREDKSYDAPEIVSTGATPAADMWSLGVTLVQALTGKVPAGPEPQFELPESTPDSLREIISHCLDRNPESRWAVNQVRARLRGEVPDDSPPLAALAAPPVPLIEELPEYPEKRNYRIPIALVILLGLAGLGGYTIYQREQSQPPAVQQPTNETLPAAQEDEPLHSAPAAPAKQSSAAPARLSSPAQAPVSNENEILQSALPDLSPSAKRSIQGIIRVSVRVQVNSAGEVTKTTLAPGGSNKYFSAQAMQAARGWRFAPAQKARTRHWILRFQFSKSGTKAVPQRLSR